ncbi:SAF domain-containing protein [Phytoactinopolyspora mesophila]|uniref:SAF domain-containing protein n=1 Tax=Phytoactinopolyspora mesophila TaxID=2650750 RepID=UPI001391B7E9
MSTSVDDQQAGEYVDQREDAGGRPVAAVRMRYARRRGLIGLGAALLALGGGGAYMLAEQASDTVQVIAIAADVPRGHVIQASDLTTAAVTPQPSLELVAASRLNELVGQRASVDLSRGNLLTPEAVSEYLIPAAGQTVVGVAVTPAQLPTEPITPGDPVRVVDTPGQGGDPPSGDPEAIPATVTSVVHTDTGHIVVNVLVDHDAAPGLAARVATGRIGIVLDSLETGGNP